MKRVLFIFVILTFAVYASQPDIIDAEYDVSFGIIGKVAKAKAHLEKDESSYRIEIVGESTGLAKSLSKNRTETQKSEGHIENGYLVPDKYSIIRSYGNKVIKRVYSFDHPNHKVELENIKFEDGKLIWQDKKLLDFYSKNDLLTLYFNINKLIPDKEKIDKYVFKAVGADKQQGDVEIIVLGNDGLVRDKNSAGSSNSWYLTAIIHQKVFSSDRGELQVLIGKDGIAEKAVLKDVLLSGDMRAELKQQKE